MFSLCTDPTYKISLLPKAVYRIPRLCELGSNQLDIHDNQVYSLVHWYLHRQVILFPGKIHSNEHPLYIFKEIRYGDSWGLIRAKPGKKIGDDY